jgi:hypothetical protein
MKILAHGHPSCDWVQAMDQTGLEKVAMIRRHAWREESLAACAHVAECIRRGANLPAFVAESLEACTQCIDCHQAEILNVIHIAKTRNFVGAHAAFDDVRELVLAAEQSRSFSEDAVGYRLLFVAENAARVLYNLSIPEDPFDSDSLEWLLISVAAFGSAFRTVSSQNAARKLLQTIEACIIASCLSSPFDD